MKSITMIKGGEWTGENEAKTAKLKSSLEYSTAVRTASRMRLNTALPCLIHVTLLTALHFTYCS